jgi:hypothetical protein
MARTSPQFLFIFQVHTGLLLLALFGLGLVFCAFTLLPPTPVASHLRDYEGFWLAGLLAHQGEVTKLYDPAALSGQMSQYFGTQGQSQGFPYPPSSLLFFMPLPFLTPATGLALFMASSVLLLLAMAYKLARGVGILLVLGFSGLHLALDYGQLTPLLTALLGLCLIQLNRYPHYAGLLAGLAVVKPHLGLLLGLGLVVGEYWRTVMVAALVVGPEAGRPLLRLSHRCYTSRLLCLMSQRALSRLISGCSH